MRTKTRMDDLSKGDLTISPKLYNVLRDISNGLLGFSCGECENKTPSEETIKQYCDEMDIPRENVDERIFNDVVWSMDDCAECANDGCPVTRLYELVNKIKGATHGKNAKRT